MKNETRTTGTREYFEKMSAMLIEYEGEDLSPREREMICSTFRSSTLWEDSF